MRWLDGTINSTDRSLSKLRETVKDREAWHEAVHGVTKHQTRPSDWTTINLLFLPWSTLFLCFFESAHNWERWWRHRQFQRKKGKEMKGGRKWGREDGRTGQIIQTKMSTTQADQRHQSLSLILFNPQTKQSRKEHNWNAPYHEPCYKLMLPIQKRSWIFQDLNHQ